MRQPGKFADNLQHRGHFKAQQLACRESGEHVRLVVQPDELHVRDFDQQGVPAREKSFFFVRANPVLTLARLVESERNDIFDVISRLGCVLVGAIDDSGMRLSVDPVLRLPVLLLARMPVEVVR